MPGVVVAVRPLRALLRPVPLPLAVGFRPRAGGPRCSPARPPRCMGCSGHRAAAISWSRCCESVADGEGCGAAVVAARGRRAADRLREASQVLPAARGRLLRDLAVGDTSRLTAEVDADFRAAGSAPAGGVRGESTSNTCVARPHNVRHRRDPAKTRRAARGPGARAARHRGRATSATSPAPSTCITGSRRVIDEGFDTEPWTCCLPHARLHVVDGGSSVREAAPGAPLLPGRPIASGKRPASKVFCNQFADGACPMTARLFQRLHARRRQWDRARARAREPSHHHRAPQPWGAASNGVETGAREPTATSSSRGRARHHMTPPTVVGALLPRLPNRDA